ncbi:MAG: hypothetical protein HeimC3_37960 [Candidatus Heimdallarchaeota archaeon LC_3]|nr:MAG: hypothetical protein HeimC3_50430 [Candidatus Heimdallarchaeota archaeon LC_3]OLS21047.1 MAG: hypothetical protein HeimC3_37960 [Candidatus Heimdallarchaeota archaeon LC_3]
MGKDIEHHFELVQIGTYRCANDQKVFYTLNEFYNHLQHHLIEIYIQYFISEFNRSGKILIFPPDDALKYSPIVLLGAVIHKNITYEFREKNLIVLEH